MFTIPTLSENIPDIDPSNNTQKIKVAKITTVTDIIFPPQLLNWFS
ncbi:hypothetical protein GIG_03737 [Mycoplasmopsis anatis 1340]|uniref:Uncharacterized protein n=1 Tax=Mycoplasmopsis anatis 1340 TaxID=1034808 RepID=F9QED2_9BACT|nr:hypothetical protein GIG_03737 [Mycoplasmopsis anatis 1340]